MVISYVTEENKRVIQALLNCLPDELHNLDINKTGTQSQFGDPLIIYSLEITDEKNISQILQFLGNQIDDKGKEYLTKNLKRKTDFDSRTIHMRFDKYRAFENEIYITEGSDVIKFELSYAAYTKNQNSYEQVRETMLKKKLITDKI